MIYVTAALYPEASALIRHFRLKKTELLRGRDVFTDHENMTLVLTGTGELNAASVTAAFLAKMNVSDDDVLLSIGSAASLCEDSGSGLYIINKMTDLNSGRSYYPDMLIHTGLKETSVLTGSTVYRKGDNIPEGYGLYDMESAAVYHAAKMFFPPHRMFFLRFVSDTGTPQAVTASDLERLSNEYLPAVKRLVEEVRKGKKTESILTKEDEEHIIQLAEQMKCTEFMKNELHGYVCYAVLTGLSLKQIEEGLSLAERLPAENKEEGKKILYEIRQFVIQ